MMTMRVLIDMMDKKTIAAISPNTESCTTNNGQPRDDLEQLRMIQGRMLNAPERGRLEISATQLHGEIDTDGNKLNRQTTVTERSEENPAVGNCEVLNKSITNTIEEEQRGSGQTPVPSSTPSGTTPQPNKGNMTGERDGQQQIQGESLVAVLIIEDDDRKEQWLNRGALVYDLRKPDTGHIICSSAP